MAPETIRTAPAIFFQDTDSLKRKIEKIKTQRNTRDFHE